MIPKKSMSWIWKMVSSILTEVELSARRGLWVVFILSSPVEPLPIFKIDCFYVRLSEFSSLLKVRRHVIGCINHDIVVGNCSKLPFRLSYYIHLGFGKVFTSRGNRTRDFFDHESSALTPQPRLLPRQYSHSSVTNHQCQSAIIMKSYAQTNLFLIIGDFWPKLLFVYKIILIVLTSTHQTFCSLFKVRRHVSWCISWLSSRPLLQAIYEVILLHPSSIW